MQINLDTIASITHIIKTKILDYLQDEHEYEVWYPMIRILEDMSTYFPFADLDVTFKASLRSLLERLLPHILFDKYVTTPFHTCLRYEVFKWACLFSSIMCHSIAHEELKHIDENISAISGQYKTKTGLWQEWIYCDGLRNVTLDVLEKVILTSKLKNNFNDAILNYIPCLGFKTVLNFLSVRHIQNKTYLPLQDSGHVILFHSLVAKHAIHGTVIELLNNFSVIKPRHMKSVTALCIIINHVYSQSALDTIIQFTNAFYKPEAPWIALVLKKVNLRLSQIKKHKNNFMQLLNTSSSAKVEYDVFKYVIVFTLHVWFIIVPVIIYRALLL